MLHRSLASCMQILEIVSKRFVLIMSLSFKTHENFQKDTFSSIYLKSNKEYVTYIVELFVYKCFRSGYNWMRSKWIIPGEQTTFVTCNTEFQTFISEINENKKWFFTSFVVLRLNQKSMIEPTKLKIIN